jgi:hypothetical protein
MLSRKTVAPPSKKTVALEVSEPRITVFIHGEGKAEVAVSAIDYDATIFPSYDEVAGYAYAWFNFLKDEGRPPNADHIPVVLRRGDAELFCLQGFVPA